MTADGHSGGDAAVSALAYGKQYDSKCTDGKHGSREVNTLEQILHYIRHKYDPISIILYGSYANETNDLNSDFDALVISAEHEPYHDTSFVDGVQLDVFVYPASCFAGDYDCEDFIQIFDGRIVEDRENMGRELQVNVQTYLQNRPRKARGEIQANVDWCAKMLERAGRCDAEGMFRWHWVLMDSLEIFCDVVGHPYFGPKKTLKWMEENHPAEFAVYQKALAEFCMDSLANWIACIQDTNEEFRHHAWT